MDRLKLILGKKLGSPVNSLESWTFFIFIFKKNQNFKNIWRIGKFSKMGVCRPPIGRLGACRPSSGRQDLNVKKVYLGLGAQCVLNSELVKLI